MGDETKTVPFEIVFVGGKYRCTYINDCRVHGSRPYASEGPETLLRDEIDIRDLHIALILGENRDG